MPKTLIEAIALRRANPAFAIDGLQLYQPFANWPGPT